jgi:copper(I)-binding protein
MKSPTSTRRLAAVAAAVALTTAACAVPALATGGGTAPTVSNAWARATKSGQENGAAYMVIKGGTTADRLVSAKAPTRVAMATELHRSVMGAGDMMTMKRVKAIPVPAGGTVTLKPGGYHVMLMGLKKPLVTGTTFRLALTFAKAGTKTVTVVVRKG